MGVGKSARQRGERHGGRSHEASPRLSSAAAISVNSEKGRKSRAARERCGGTSQAGGVRERCGSWFRNFAGAEQRDRADARRLALLSANVMRERESWRGRAALSLLVM